MTTSPATASVGAPRLRVFGAPLRYIQGPGALDSVGAQAALTGRVALLVADRVVLQLVEDKVRASCDAAGVRLEVALFSGEVTPPEIDRLCDQVRALAPTAVIAAGGGKGIDIGKAVAHALGAEVVSVPTVASNDAPTSKIYVVYDDSHRLLAVEHMDRNPSAVIVDTELIARAPARLLLAGIGDAISKTFEVEQCQRAGGANIYGGAGTLAASALAALCYDMLRANAPAALRAVERQQPDAALENCVEAAVLLSGMCFENGGLSIAHAMTRGLTAVRGARDALHGLQVAYGLLVQLVLEERDLAFVQELVGFYRSIGLPTALADLGVPAPTEAEIQQIAELTMTAPHVRNFQRPLDAAQIAAAIHGIEAEQAIAAAA